VRLGLADGVGIGPMNSQSAKGDPGGRYNAGMQACGGPLRYLGFSVYRGAGVSSGVRGLDDRAVSLTASSSKQYRLDGLWQSSLIGFRFSICFGWIEFCPCN